MWSCAHRSIVNHNILCQVVEHYDVKHREVHRLNPASRKQFCRVTGVDSKIETIATRVPQGLCLGLLLFLLSVRRRHRIPRGNRESRRKER